MKEHEDNEEHDNKDHRKPHVQQHHEGLDNEYHHNQGGGSNPFKYMIALGDEHSKHLNRLCELYDEQKKTGRTFHIVMTLGNTDVLSRIVYVDFVRGKNKNGSRNLPADTTEDFPYRKVFSLTIKNRTGGSDINFNVNRGPNATSLNGLIATGAEKTFDSLFPVFENINLTRVSTGSSTSVVELTL
jgi:hypothetical protein